MTDTEAAVKEIARLLALWVPRYDDLLEGDGATLEARTALREEFARQAAAVAIAAERTRVLGLLEEWREAMTAVGQVHSLEYMLNEVRNGNTPERHARSGGSARDE